MESPPRDFKSLVFTSFTTRAMCRPVAAAVPIVVSAVLEIKREGVTQPIKGLKLPGNDIDFNASPRYVANWRE